ncbi:MAG: cyclophilin-like fold protein [bacterium]|nr:cyclophilin-like fold protein [bacterium]
MKIKFLHIILGVMLLTGCAFYNNRSTQPEMKNENISKENNQMNITVGEHVFKVMLANNSSADALKEYLVKGPVTLALSDYSGFEKVGNLGTTLPQNNEKMNTVAGDIILYQGNQFVIYYGENSWNLTRLGKIEGVSKEELQEVLGNGDVEVIISLP